MSGRIQDKAKLFERVEGRKLHGTKNNPVYRIWILNAATTHLHWDQLSLPLKQGGVEISVHAISGVISGTSYPSGQLSHSVRREHHQVQRVIAIETMPARDLWRDDCFQWRQGHLFGVSVDDCSVRLSGEIHADGSI